MSDYTINEQAAFDTLKSAGDAIETFFRSRTPDNPELLTRAVNSINFLFDSDTLNGMTFDKCCKLIDAIPHLFRDLTLIITCRERTRGTESL